MKRYTHTGILSSTKGTERKPIFGDFTKQKDYQASLNTVILAEEAFSELPAKIRRRFDDKPSEFLKFMENPENFEEAKELNLITVTKTVPTEKEILTSIAENLTFERKKQEKSVEKPASQSEE